MSRGRARGGTRAVDEFDELHLGGIDRWTRTTCRARVALAAGDYDAAFAELTSLSDADLEDRETILERITMRADALAWLGNRAAARDAVDQGQRALEAHREAYFHGLFALSAMRTEADAAAAASTSGSLDQLEEAHERGRAILASWNTTVSELQGSAGIVEAFSLGIDAERARLATRPRPRPRPAPPTGSKLSRCGTTRRTSAGARPKRCSAPANASPRPTS